MRQKVQRLNQYQLLCPFKFVDLVYLSGLFEQRSYNYKEYLYREGDQPSSIYLIQEGQFYYTKYLQEPDSNKIRDKTLKKKLLKRKIGNKISAGDNGDDSIHIVERAPKKKQYKVGSFSQGQSLGEEQIVNEKPKRVYNAKCASYMNRVIIIDKQHFLKVLQKADHQITKGIRQKVMKKNLITNNIFKGIMQTQKNIEMFLFVLQQQRQKSMEKKKKEKQKEQQKLSQSQIDDQYEKLPAITNNKPIFSSQLKNKIQSMKSKSLPRSKRSVQSLKSVDARANDQIHGPEVQTSTFALTQALMPKLSKQNFFNQDQTISQEKEQKAQDFHSSVEKNKHNNTSMNGFDISVPMKVAKSWNNKDLKLFFEQKANRKQKFSGMIDSSTLIKEKQHIMQIRRKHSLNNRKFNHSRQQFEEKQRALFKRAQFQKKRAKELQSNPAHSKQYMEKILLEALKRAGYQEAASASQLSPSPLNQQDQDSIMEIATQMTGMGRFNSQNFDDFKPKIDKKYIPVNLNSRFKKQWHHHHHSHHRNNSTTISDVLQENPFDQCYFDKI